MEEAFRRGDWTSSQCCGGWRNEFLASKWGIRGASLHHQGQGERVARHSPLSSSQPRRKCSATTLNCSLSGDSHVLVQTFAILLKRTLIRKEFQATDSRTLCPPTAGFRVFLLPPQGPKLAEDERHKEIQAGSQERGRLYVLQSSYQKSRRCGSRKSIQFWWDLHQGWHQTGQKVSARRA